MSYGSPSGPAIKDHRVEWIQFTAATTSFIIGASVYLFDRSAADIYFIPAWWHFADGTPALFGALGGYLPSMAHVYCFILLTQALLTPWRVAPLTVCISWVAAEAFLELAQFSPVAARLVTLLPGWLGDWPILGNVPHYFSHGRFDPLDLLCIGIGGVAAWITIVFTRRVITDRTGI